MMNQFLQHSVSFTVTLAFGNADLMKTRCWRKEGDVRTYCFNFNSDLNSSAKETCGRAQSVSFGVRVGCGGKMSKGDR